MCVQEAKKRIAVEKYKSWVSIFLEDKFVSNGKNYSFESVLVSLFCTFETSCYFSMFIRKPQLVSFCCVIRDVDLSVLIMFVQKTVSAAYVFKMIRVTCMGFKRRMTKQELAENNTFTTMIDEIYKAYWDKKTNPRDLLSRLAVQGKETMPQQSGSMMVPYLRYLIRAADATLLDVENRDRVLEFTKRRTPDPLGVAISNIENQKKKKKNEQEMAQQEESQSDTDQVAQGDKTVDIKPCGAQVKVWAVPGNNLVEYVVINGDIFSDIPQAHYDLVVMDPPFGYHKFTGDVDWTMSKVCLLYRNKPFV